MANVFYTVQPVDLDAGLMGIARRIYGNERWWPLLYDANRGVIGENPALLERGQQLLVPEFVGHDAACRVQVYHVQPCDLDGGLVGIALRLWQERSLAAWLYAINRGIIGDDPQQIKVGQRLLVVPA